MHASFWSAVLATLIAVYGVFVTPITWINAGLIWAYALVWVAFNDFVKIQSLRLVRARDGR